MNKQDITQWLEENDYFDGSVSAYNQAGLIHDCFKALQPQWVAGVPIDEGHYWLELQPTNKVGERMQKHKIKCYSFLCGCHKSWVNMDKQNAKRIKDGFYEVVSYLPLPPSEGE
tara:strand:+ start:2365 stop:2706 length:342 start_codon:yes stop_codon:yes gene_type:complete